VQHKLGGNRSDRRDADDTDLMPTSARCSAMRGTPIGGTPHTSTLRFYTPRGVDFSTRRLAEFYAFLDGRRRFFYVEFYFYAFLDRPTVLNPHTGASDLALFALRDEETEDLVSTLRP
jgi:hypothetical protein